MDDSATQPETYSFFISHSHAIASSPRIVGTATITHANGGSFSVPFDIPPQTSPTPDQKPLGTSTGRGFPAPIVPMKPKPLLGKVVTGRVVSGVVKVRTPGALSFVKLEGDQLIPVGSLLDTRKGVLLLTSAVDSSGRTQSGTFSTGVFQVRQSAAPSAKGLTELRLTGSSFRSCRSAGHSRAAAATHSRRTIRRLRSNANGRFRTRGRYSAATVRGTTWTTTDRCDGTLTKVSSGSVTVRDLRRRKTLIVRSGRSYLARAR